MYSSCDSMLRRWISNTNITKKPSASEEVFADVFFLKKQDPNFQNTSSFTRS
jgi:hypothetical protein